MGGLGIGDEGGGLTDVEAKNLLCVAKGVFPARAIVVEVVVEGLAEEVLSRALDERRVRGLGGQCTHEAVKMVQAFDVGWEAAAVFVGYLDVAR